MRAVVVLLLISLLDVAFAKTSIVLPSPVELGMETSAVLVLPEMASNKAQRLTISVEASNVATNQLEIWFCNDIFGSRESRDCLIGFDEGRLITGRDTADSIMLHRSVLPVQNMAFAATVRSRIDPFRAKVNLAIGGAAYPIESQSSHLWRSIRVVSRGLDYPQPCLVSNLETISLLICVR